LTREVIICKEIKHLLNRKNYLAANQQIVEVKAGLFDTFYLERTDLERNTIRDNSVNHLVSIDSSLFDPWSQISVDIYYNNLNNYPKIDTTNTTIRFKGSLKKYQDESQKKPLSEKGQKLLRAYFNRVKQIFEKPLDFLQKHFFKLRKEITNQKSKEEYFFKCIEEFEAKLYTQQEFTDEFKQKILNSFESIVERIKYDNEEQIEEAKEEEIEVQVVFDHDEETSDFAQIREKIYETSWQIEKCLFQNKTILFMHKKMIEVFTQKWRQRIDVSSQRTVSNESKIVIVKNEYIALDPFILLMRYLLCFAYI